jgi:hypothetical protein
MNASLGIPLYCRLPCVLTGSTATPLDEELSSKARAAGGAGGRGGRSGRQRGGSGDWDEEEEGDDDVEDVDWRTTVSGTYIHEWKTLCDRCCVLMLPFVAVELPQLSSLLPDNFLVLRTHALCFHPTPFPPCRAQG